MFVARKRSAFFCHRKSRGTVAFTIKFLRSRVDVCRTRGSSLHPSRRLIKVKKKRVLLYFPSMRIL